MQQKSSIAVHVIYDQQDEEQTVEKSCNDNSTASSSVFPPVPRFFSPRESSRERPLQQRDFQSLDPTVSLTQIIG